MDKFERLILRWVCLFDDFKDNEYSSIKNLVTDKSFKEFVDNVFYFKCSTPTLEEDETLYNTIKVNYQEFEIQTYKDLYHEDNSVYTCVVVLLHALLKCTNNKFRNQLSERMDNEEQILLAKFLEATQSTLFTKNNICEALMLTSDKKLSSSNVSEIFSNDVTPIKSKAKRRSYLQEFCESPKSQFLIYQEKEKLIAKLTEDYKSECEENYKMAENLKILKDMNTKLNNKLENKDKIIQFLKDEIEEFSKSKEDSTDCFKVDDSSLLIKKLNQDVIDLDINNNELKNQIAELENKHKDLNGKFEKITFDYENLLFTFDNIEVENLTLKENMDAFKKTLQEKDIEIASLKDELCNKSISNNPLNSSCKEANVPMNTLFDELSCLKLEEVTHDKEKYRHKYKSVRKDLLNAENHVKDLDGQIINLKQQLHDCELNTGKLINEFSDKEREIQETKKKNNSLENKIKHIKDSIKAKEYDIESLCTKLDKKENRIKELLEEMDSIKKAKTMIELILSKTNTEIEVLHEENNKYVNNLLATIEDYKHSEKVSHDNIVNLQNNIKQIEDDLVDKKNIIISFKEKMFENDEVTNIQKEELNTIRQEKLVLESSLKDLKNEIEIQQKTFSNKHREMENSLHYHLDELKEVKNTVLKLEIILQHREHKINQQKEVISHQQNIISTLQSEKHKEEIIVNNLNSVLKEKSTENMDLKEKVQEFILNIGTLNEQLNTTSNERTMLEKELKVNEEQMKKSNDEFQNQICDMQNVLESRNNEINQFTINIENLKDTLEKKQNDFNDQLIINNKQIETISHLRLENYELKENLKLNHRGLLDKDNEIVSLKDTIVQNELKFSDLTEKINFEISKYNSLVKNVYIVTSTIKNMQNDFDKQLLNFKSSLQFCDNKIIAQTEKLSELKNYLFVKKGQLDTQINLCNNQKEHISTLETERVNLLREYELLNQCILEKDTKIVTLEKNLQNHSLTTSDLKEKLGVMSIEKVMIETNLNDITDQFKNSQSKFTDQINNITIQLNDREEKIIQLKTQTLEMENMLNKKQKEFDDQLKLTSAQCEIVNTMKSEKEILEEQVLNANRYNVTVQDKIESLTATLDKFRSTILDLEKELDYTKMEKNISETELKDTIREKNAINQELSEKLNDVNNYLKDSTNENNDLKNCLRELNNDLNTKITQFNLAIEENNTLKETISYTGNHCVYLQNKLKELNACILKKEEDIKLREIQNVEYLTANDNLEKEIHEIKHTLNNKCIELENETKSCNEQEEIIVKLNCEKESLCDKIKSLEDTMLHQEYKFNLCEGKLYDCSNMVSSLEQKLAEMKTEKSFLELQMNETITELTVQNQDLTLQLEIKDNNVLQIQEKLIQVQNDFEVQKEQANEHIKTINLLNAEKDTLLNETDTLLKSLNEKDYTFNSLQQKIFDYEKQFDKLETLKINLESELEKNKFQLNDLHQKSKQQIEDTEKKCTEMRELFDKKQVEINEYVDKYNCQMETIADLTSERDNLINEIETFKNTLLNKDGIIASNEGKLLKYEEDNNNIKAKTVALEIEFKEIINQLETLCQELTQQLEDTKNKYTEIQEQFNTKQVEMYEYVGKCDSQMETIALLTSEKDNLISEVKKLKNTLLNQESVIASNKEKLLEYEEINDYMKTEKIALEIESKKTITQLETTCQELTQKFEDVETKLCEIDALKNSLLEKDNTLASNHKELSYFKAQLEELHTQKYLLLTELKENKFQLARVQDNLSQQSENATNKLQEVQKQLIMLQNDLEERNKCYNEQTKTLNTLTREKNNLLQETNMFKEMLVQKENALVLNQEKLLDSEKQNKEIELQNASLRVNVLELNRLKVLLDNLRQEFTEQIVKMDKQLSEDQEQIDQKQSEIKNQIKLKNDSLVDIFQKINSLKNIKNELEMEFKKERINFETSLEMYSNSLNCHSPIQDHREHSLMEVITSADTFIEQNGIQLAQVENYEEYSIIERLKKLFEALKMFIININSQENDRAITNIKNEYASNEAYDELLLKSNMQQETIDHLENEISKLKTECNYKMTKIQQKTQEFITAEYEKKFERKRDQMKQFCKSLETKIHQDYESKLIKYKDKINKDEMHIKELGQQLWEVSEKYLQLQRKERRESTMSLPLETSIISQATTNILKYNSSSLPKSISAGQIRSLIEETTRSQQDISKRNVPSGIGKKFSLSSGKIFPKEEDEEGEMFNHSCLADLKQGRVRLNNDYYKQNNERLSELQARNSLCPPHLRSCYAVETNYLLNTSIITEEDIKASANYSNCESENLIPNDRNKKKDRNQTSYKKPGPPTPSKNGGRSSLSGNTKISLKESKESNMNKRRASSTPNKLFSLFMGKK